MTLTTELEESLIARSAVKRQVRRAALLQIVHVERKGRPEVREGCPELVTGRG